MSHRLPGHETKKSPLERLGLSSESGRAAPYLRAILTFVKVSSEEQLKQIPIIGPLILGASEALKDLSEEQDDQKLERRVESLLTIGEQTQEDIRLLTGLAGLIFVQQQQLLAQLQSAGLPADRRQLTEFATEAALIAYRSRVARDYQYVDNRGIEGGTRAEHAAALPLDDIYIVPRLLPERERETVREREKDVLNKLLDDRGDLTSEQRVRLEEEYAIITGERWRPGTKKQDEGLALGKALERAPHAVIIGGPGVGKSVLTRYLARACALGRPAMDARLGWSDQLVPVLIPLAAFADARATHPDLKLRDFLDDRMVARGGDALRAVVSEELDKGRLYIILDGVDEVPDSHSRAALVQAVDDFILDYADNRFLITSRPYGYIRLAGDLTHFQLLNFSPAQVEEFIHCWQRAFERRQHPDAPNFEEAKEQANALVEEIRRSPKVSELATNPLMLVIISLIRYEKARLPEERVQLYNRAVNTLMDTWNQWRSRQAKDIGGATLPLDRLIRVWGAVAEWMRREKPTGVVHRAELKRELVCVLEEKEYDEDTPEATAEAYLRAAADRAGLLEERGIEIFGFWHPTFEEFLAAVELTTPTSRAIERLLPLRHDPRWREVILLAVGYVGIVQRDNETATQIVEAIAFKETPPEEPVTHPCLRLAADCIADDVGVKRTLSQRIIVELARIIQAQPYYELTEVFIKTVRALPKLRARPETISALAPLADYNNWEVRMEVARVFSNVTTENAEALTLCRRLLGDVDGDVRCHAALGLARADEMRPEVWLGLLRFDSGYTQMKPAAREFLAARLDEAEAAWIPLLESDDEELRDRALWALRGIRRLPAGVLDNLFSGLETDDRQTRIDAALQLISLGKNDERIFDIFLAELTADGASEIDKEKAFWSLMEVVESSDARTTEIMYTWVVSDSSMLIDKASFYFSRFGQADDLMTTRLLALLADENRAVRFNVAWVLYRMGNRDEKVFDAFVAALDSEDVDTRLIAARILRDERRLEERVIETLSPLLNNESAYVRLEAAQLLTAMKAAGEEVVNALLPIVTNDEDFKVSAVQILSEYVEAKKRVQDALLAQLTAGDVQSRLQTANLIRVAGLRDLALETIARMVEPRPWAALGAFQKVLNGQEITREDGDALSVLVSVRDGDTEVQKQARELLFRWLWEALEPQEGAAA
jgi:HEAT repeats/NACHT domain